jgi:hypothetical protein
VWWDRELQTGGAWESELDRQVMLAGCVIVLWSERSARSSWVRHEASAAMGRDNYLPVTIEKVDVPDPFGRIHTAELVGWDGSPDHPGFRALLDSLERKLGRRAIRYELAGHERMRPWPPRIPRHPAQRAAYWFRRNMATLIATAALATLAFTVLATEESVQRLDAQVTHVNEALEQTRTFLDDKLKETQLATQHLDFQVAAVNRALESTNAELQLQLEEFDMQQEAIAHRQLDIFNELVTLAKANKGSAAGILAVATLSAKSTQSLLEDNLKRVEAFEIQLLVDLDPLEMMKAEAVNFLPTDLAEAISAEREGGQKLENKQFDRLVAALRGRRQDVRDAFFGGWELTATLRRSKHPPPAGDDAAISKSFQQDDGLRSFVISHVRGGETTVVQCSLIYRIQTHGAAGLRTYEDFRGADLTLKIRADSRWLKPTTGRFFLAGDARDVLSIRKDELTQPSDTSTEWQATLSIPNDYLSHLSIEKPEIPAVPAAK